MARFVSIGFVSICFVSFRFVSFRFDLFRFVSICFVSFWFVSFRFDLFLFVSVSFRTLQGPLRYSNKTHIEYRFILLYDMEQPRNTRVLKLLLYQLLELYLYTCSRLGRTLKIQNDYYLRHVPPLSVLILYISLCQYYSGCIPYLVSILWTSTSCGEREVNEKLQISPSQFDNIKKLRGFKWVHTSCLTNWLRAAGWHSKNKDANLESYNSKIYRVESLLSAAQFHQKELINIQNRHNEGKYLNRNNQ